MAAFSQARVPVLWLKGPVLAVLLGDEARWSSDIDLLVNSRDWSQAIRVLRAAGYDRAVPGQLVVEDAVHAWTFVGTRFGLSHQVDLHHRFHGVRVSSRRIWSDAWGDRIVVPTPGGPLDTLSLAMIGYVLAASSLPEFHGTAKRREEFRRFCALHNVTNDDLRLVGQRWRAPDVVEAAIQNLTRSSRPHAADALAHLRYEPRWRDRFRVVSQPVFPPPAWLAWREPDGRNYLDRWVRRVRRRLGGRRNPS